MGTTTTKATQINTIRSNSRLITLAARMMPTGMATLLMAITIDLCRKANSSSRSRQIMEVVTTLRSKIHSLLSSLGNPPKASPSPNPRPTVPETWQLLTGKSKLLWPLALKKSGQIQVSSRSKMLTSKVVLKLEQISSQKPSRIWMITCPQVPT